MDSTPFLGCAGRRRSPATTSSFHKGLAPRNKGVRVSAGSADGRDRRGDARRRRQR